MSIANERVPVAFETLRVRAEGAVLFAKATAVAALLDSDFEAGAPGSRTGSPLRRRRRAGGSEEVDEQLVDVLGLVVVDPVRGVGQALDAVEVGHVVVVGLSERRAEEAVAPAPDDQRRRRDGTDLPRRVAHREAVIVDHRRLRPRLRPRLDVTLYLLGRVRRLRVAQEVLEELPVIGSHVALGQPRELEVEEVPGPA